MPLSQPDYPNDKTELTPQGYITAHLAWWEFDPHTQAAVWSPECRKLFGLRSDRPITYADWVGAIHPDDFKRADEATAEALEKTGVYDEEYRVIGIDDGMLRWVRSSGKVVYDEAGKPVKVVGFMLETTQGRLASAISEASDHRLKVLADTLPQLVWVTLPDGYHDFYNRRWFEYTGRTYSQTKGEGWNAVLHPDDQTRAMHIWQHSLQTGEAYEIEYRLRRYDGVYRWFLGRALPLRDQDGQISKWFGTCTDIHDQKLVNEELREAQERFDLISKATRDAIWDWDLTTNEIWWNEGFRKLFGYEEEDIEPTIESWTNRVHPEDKDRVVSSIHRVIDIGGKNWSDEYRFRRKDGTYAFVLDRGYALHDETGKPYRMLGSMQDVSAQKQIEMTLSESEKRFRSLTLNSPDLITRHGRDFRYLYASPVIEQLTGMKPEALIGKSYYEVNIPEHLCSLFDEHLRQVFETRKPHHLEYSAATDREVFLNSRLVPEFDAAGEIESVLVISTDVTEQRKAEASLKESEERFRTLSNSISQLAWMADADGWIFWYNDRWYDYTGTTLEQMKGWGWQTVHHPDHLERVLSFIREAWQKGEPWELTFPLRSRHGHYRWFLTKVFPLKNGEGKVTRWIGSNTDITEQKQAEEILEQRVRERTLELERRNKELEQFTYVSHHDLQEPIRKIQVFSDMIRADSYERLNDSSKRILDKIANSAKRMSLALKDVLDYASLEKPEEIRPVDLNEVLADVRADLELVISEKQAVIQTDRLPTLQAIPQQMHQLFYNLINNSLKFAKPDLPPVVDIRCARLSGPDLTIWPELDQSRAYYRLDLQDNGIGIDPDQSHRIFSLFQRLHSREAYPGTGIGLSLCKKVVENHRGTIWAEGRKGEGATIRLLLPVE